MNKFRNTAIALVILVLLNVYILTNLKKEEKLPEPDMVFSDIASPIERIELQYPEGDSLEFKKNEKNDWEMTFPYHFKAAEYKVDDMLDSLESLNYIQSVKASPEEQKDFGFGQGPFKVVFNTKEKERSIELGFRTFDNRNYYAKASDTDEILVINEMFISHFERDPLGYKDLEVAAFNKDEIKTISLVGNDVSFEVNKKDDTFEISLKKYNKEVPYVHKEAHELIQELTYFAAGRWINLNVKDFSLYGLEKPIYKLTIKGKDKTVNINIGRFENVWYGRIAQNPEVFEVTSYIFTLLDKLEKKEEKLPPEEIDK